MLGEKPESTTACAVDLLKLAGFRTGWAVPLTKATNAGGHWPLNGAVRIKPPLVGMHCSVKTVKRVILVSGRAGPG